MFTSFTRRSPSFQRSITGVEVEVPTSLRKVAAITRALPVEINEYVIVEFIVEHHAAPGAVPRVRTVRILYKPMNNLQLGVGCGWVLRNCTEILVGVILIVKQG